MSKKVTAPKEEQGGDTAQPLASPHMESTPEPVTLVHTGPPAEAMPVNDQEVRELDYQPIPKYKEPEILSTEATTAPETPKIPADILESLEVDLGEWNVIEFTFPNGEVYQVSANLVVESITSNFEAAIAHGTNNEGKSEQEIFAAWIRERMSWYDFEKEARLVGPRLPKSQDYLYDNFLRATIVVKEGGVE